MTTKPWTTGLFSCFEDVNICCLTCWCPCISFGRIAEIADKGSSSCVMSGSIYAAILTVIGCPCFYSCYYRAKVRGQFSLVNWSPEDCCIHCWCEPCALCQEYRELENRGFDLSIGWQGNLERQSPATAPAIEGRMTR